MDRNDHICVFCGQKPGLFQDTFVDCANVEQPACKACEKELKGLEEAELCRRALVRGIAVNPDRLRKRISLITEAEEHRPKCLRCEGKLKFANVQHLDNSPYRDTIFADTFRVLPAFCTSCGKYELYHPDIVRMNKYLAYLINKDTQTD